MTVLAATAWNTNGDMIAEVVQLGFLQKDWVTLDPTYGRGLWWSKWRPSRLVAHDKFTLDGVDFRALPYPDEYFDASVFDPPYVSVGGRKTSTLKPVDNSRGPHRRTREGSDFHDRYGLRDAAKTPAGVQRDINLGLAEVARVTRPGGYILVKCQDYISGGKFWPGVFLTTKAGRALNLEIVDVLLHLGGVRPQPGGRKQRHARRNLSTLIVFRRRIDVFAPGEFICGCHSSGAKCSCEYDWASVGRKPLVCVHPSHTREETPPWRGLLVGALVEMISGSGSPLPGQARAGERAR